MKKLFFVLSLLLAFSLVSSQAMLFAQDEPLAATTPTEPLTDSQFTYGTVISVDPAVIKISEYDFETDTSEDVTYDVSPDVKCENVNSIKDVKEGDEVELEYVIKDGKRTAISIYVE